MCVCAMHRKLWMKRKYAILNVDNEFPDDILLMSRFLNTDSKSHTQAVIQSLQQKDGEKTFSLLFSADTEFSSSLLFIQMLIIYTMCNRQFSQIFIE